MVSLTKFLMKLVLIQSFKSFIQEVRVLITKFYGTRSGLSLLSLPNVSCEEPFVTNPRILILSQ